MTWTEERMQLALTGHPKAKFYARRWHAVPNVSYGLPSIIQPAREVDLLCIPTSKWVHAVEIKVTESDLRADARKHWRKVVAKSNIRFEWFAVPQELADACLVHSPPTAGVISVSTVTRTYKPWGKEPYDVTEWHNEVLRQPEPNCDARKMTDPELLLLLRLGVMRMWAKRSTK